MEDGRYTSTSAVVHQRGRLAGLGWVGSQSCSCLPVAPGGTFDFVHAAASCMLPAAGVQIDAKTAKLLLHILSLVDYNITILPDYLIT